MEKKKRLFYYNEGIAGFIPFENKEDLEFYLDGLYDKETLTITFKRIDMTDEEFENLPEAESLS